MLTKPPEKDENGARHKVYNIGNNTPVKLLDFIGILEKETGITAQKEFLPMQAGDVYQTYADVTDLMRDFDFRPSTPLEHGLKEFVKWYKEFYKK